MESTANLPPLVILEELQFLKKISYVLRNHATAVAFYGKIAIISC